MHDVLRQRLLRKIESLPEEQVYQVLDYIEFLESKYARHLPQEATGLQKFAEGLEDRLRKKAVSPATIREAFQLIATADRVLSSVSTAGTRLLGELGAMGEVEGGGGAAEGRSAASAGAGETPPHGDPLRRREGPSGEGPEGSRQG